MSSPNTIINFYDVYDLTPDYNHTRYFQDSDARDDFFDARIAETVTPTQHIRIDGLEVKIPLPLEDIHGYCYMSIQNSKVIASSSTYDHRYYCFIIDMEYVSDMCTLVRYEIDVMQTFCMDGLFGRTMPYESFVTRCHGQTDVIGDNLIEEPFSVDDHIIMYRAGATIDLYSSRVIVGICTTRLTSLVIEGETFNFEPNEYYNGIYTGARYFQFDLSDATSALKLKGLLAQFASHASEIVSIYSVPNAVLPASPQGNPSTVGFSSPPNALSNFTGGVNGSNDDEGFEGYQPKNNKLFTYPYTKLRLTNGEGEKLDLAFELFDDPDYCKFYIEGAFIGDPAISMYPYDYARKYDSVSPDHTPNYDYSIGLTNFCSGAYSENALAAYLEKESLGSLIKCITGTITSAGIGFALGGGATYAAASILGTGITPAVTKAGMKGEVMGGLMGGSAFIKGQADMIADYIRAQHTGDVPSGQNNRGAVAQQNGHKRIEFQRLKIRRYLAEQIDNFFNMYGYAQNKLINIGTYLYNHSRDYYSYIQTKNFSVLNGGFEQKYKRQIADIMNHGITFWFDEDTPVGDYAVDNSLS